MRFFEPNYNKMVAHKDVSGLIKLLKDPELNVRREAALALKQLNDPKAIQPLIQALNDKVEVRNAAVQTLGSMGQPAVEQVAKLLDNQSDYIRYWATKILASIGQPASRHLFRAFRDYSSIREVAVEGVALFANPNLVEAVEPLTEILKKDYRGKTNKGLNDFANFNFYGSYETNTRNTDIYAAKALASIGKPAYQSILWALKHSDPEVRKVASWALIEMGDDRSIELLSEIVQNKDESRQTKEDAVVRLANFGKSAIQTLLIALTDNNYSVKRQATEALGKILDANDRYVFEHLNKAINDEHDDIRLNVLKMLVTVGSNSIIDTLILTLNDKNTDIQLYSAEKLGESKDRRAIDPLLEHLFKDTLIVSNAAARALRKIGHIPITSMYKALDMYRLEPLAFQRHDSIMELFAEIGDESRAQVVLDELRLFEKKGHKPENQQRVEAIRLALKKIGLPAIKLLVNELRKPSSLLHYPMTSHEAKYYLEQIFDWKPVDVIDKVYWLIDEEAWEFLVAIGQPAIEPLVCLYSESDENISRKKVAAKTLDRIGWKPVTLENRIYFYIWSRNWKEIVYIGTNAVPILIEAVSSLCDYELRINMVQALVLINDKRAIKPLSALLNEKFFDNYVAKALVYMNDDKALKSVLSWITQPTVYSLDDIDDNDKANLNQTLTDLSGIIGLEITDIDSKLKVLTSLESCLTVKEAPKIKKDVIINTLKSMGWRPSNNAASAYYWISKGKYNQCVAIGEPAVELLIDAMNVGSDASIELIAVAGQIKDSRFVMPLINYLKSDIKTRTAAATALKAIYYSGKLNAAQKQEILQHRTGTKQRHSDDPRVSHDDHGHSDEPSGSNDCRHSDDHGDHYQHQDQIIQEVDVIFEL